MNKSEALEKMLKSLFLDCFNADRQDLVIRGIRGSTCWFIGTLAPVAEVVLPRAYRKSIIYLTKRLRKIFNRQYSVDVGIFKLRNSNFNRRGTFKGISLDRRLRDLKLRKDE